MHERETKRAAALTASDWGSPLHIRALVLILATGAGIYLCYLLARPFIPALTGAVALAVLFAPLHRWLESRTRRPNLAATISIVLIVLVVLLPVAFVVDRIIAEADRAADALKTLVEGGVWRRALEAHPGIAPLGRWIDQYFDLPGLLQTAAAWLTDITTSFVWGSVLQLVGFVLAFYLLFYLLRDRSAVLESLRAVSPLSKEDMNQLLGEIHETVRTTVYGTFAVAAVQGVLGGLMFWWLGLAEPLLWGVVMGLLGVVPVLGAFVIWIPAAIFLALEGSGWKAMLLVIWGTIVVGGIDNLLYPMIVGQRLKLHSILALVSILGGLIVLGPSGLILGPVTFTVTRVLLEIWGRRNEASSA
jgi:predicted PurR-regulated permease PerM